jgi:peptidoglycan hydrolase-like protein with peptidoglycan-binding domain
MTNFKGFKGAAKRVEDIDLPRLGAQIGVGEDELHAFMEAETRGSGFDSQGRPRILFERHKFYKYCPEGKRAAAVKAGLANPKAGGYGKESEQYGKLAKAMAIDEHAALLSCSWGLAQVMGFNHELAGYPTVEAMILAFMDDEEAHLQAAVTFIKNSGLDDELRRHDWKGFAKGYNGTGYAVNKYDQKLAAAYVKWSKIKDTPFSPSKPAPALVVTPAVDLYDGKPHDEIRAVQVTLNDIGYPEVGTIDAKWGTKTAAAVLAFRLDNGLQTADPRIDGEFLAKLALRPQRPIAEARANATVADLRAKDDDAIRKSDKTKIALGTMGALVAVPEGIDKGLSVIETYTGYMQRVRALIDPVVSFVTDNAWLIVGAGTAYGVYKLWDLDVLRLRKHQTGGDVTQ